MFLDVGKSGLLRYTVCSKILRLLIVKIDFSIVYIVSVKKSVELNLYQIYEDRFILEEGVYWRYTTDEKINIDPKDMQIVQVIF